MKHVINKLIERLGNMDTNDQVLVLTVLMMGATTFWGAFACNNFISGIMLGGFGTPLFSALSAIIVMLDEESKTKKEKEEKRAARRERYHKL